MEVSRNPVYKSLLIDCLWGCGVEMLSENIVIKWLQCNHNWN